MVSKQQEIIGSKIKSDNIWRYISMSMSWLFAIIFLCLIGFIIASAVPGFKAYGINNILFSLKFNLNSKDNVQASVWLPLAMTLLVSFGAIIIAAPIGVKTATFIKFRISKKYRRKVRIVVETLAGIPSVVFGLFASVSLGWVIQNVFHLNSQYNVFTAFVMLAFMILPTIVSLTLNTYEGISENLLSNPIALGNSRTRSIYKVYKKQAKSGIVVAIIIATGRAIGETMAISMILGSQGYDSVINSGFLNVLQSGLMPLGAVIANNMFSENGGAAQRGVLYAFGILLFVIIMILNGVVAYTTKAKKKSKYKWWNNIELFLSYAITFIPYHLGVLFESVTYRSPIKVNGDDISNVSIYVSTRIQKNKFRNIYSYYKWFWEIVSITITLGFLIWIILDIVGMGGYAIANGNTTIFEYSKDTTGQATINTILIILVALVIGLPIALLAAIYLNEYSKENKVKKTILFFIDSLGATPSILFGMFGLAFFIETLGLSSGGSQGKSLIAGAFTILLVILPSFIRSIQQALVTVPMEARHNSYGLGASKWETIRKIVLPNASRGIITAIILSIGRILAETAPLYLTAGLSSSAHIALNNPGQTLTTRIYAQLTSPVLSDGTNIMYEAALVTIIFVFVIIIVGHAILPLYYEMKQEFKTRWLLYQNANKYKRQFDFTLYENQIINDKLYLTFDQAKFLKLNPKKQKVLKYHSHYGFTFKLIKIRYITDKDMKNMKKKYSH